MQTRMDIVNGFLLVSMHGVSELRDCDTSALVFSSKDQSECIRMASVLSEVKDVIGTVADPNTVADLIVNAISVSMEARQIAVEVEPAPSPEAAPVKAEAVVE